MSEGDERWKCVIEIKRDVCDCEREGGLERVSGNEAERIKRKRER